MFWLKRPRLLLVVEHVFVKQLHFGFSFELRWGALRLAAIYVVTGCASALAPVCLKFFAALFHTSLMFCLCCNLSGVGGCLLSTVSTPDIVSVGQTHLNIHLHTCTSKCTYACIHTCAQLTRRKSKTPTYEHTVHAYIRTHTYKHT